jgi:hypothetical protein
LRTLLSILFAAALSAIAPAYTSAQERLPIFDAHMHYNWEPAPFLPPDKLLDVFRKNGVTGILSTSRPNDGTHALIAEKAKDIWIVPFIRPYRTRADIQTWFKDPAIYELIENEYKRGYFRGIGEFHIYGPAASSEIVGKIVRFALDRDLFLHAHCDEQALELLLGHDRNAKLIWAHTGFSVAPARVAELFEKYPHLMGELSFRGGITDGAGNLTPEWKELFARHSDRFLLGSDTWIHPRWEQYDEIMDGYRRWLAQLPPDQARRVAHENAARLFGPRRVN